MPQARTSTTTTVAARTLVDPRLVAAVMPQATIARSVAATGVVPGLAMPRRRVASLLPLLACLVNLASLARSVASVLRASNKAPRRKAPPLLPSLSSRSTARATVQRPGRAVLVPRLVLRVATRPQPRVPRRRVAPRAQSLVVGQSATTRTAPRTRRPRRTQPRVHPPPARRPASLPSQRTRTALPRRTLTHPSQQTLPSQLATVPVAAGVVDAALAARAVVAVAAAVAEEHAAAPARAAAATSLLLHPQLLALRRQHRLVAPLAGRRPLHKRPRIWACTQSLTSYTLSLA